MMHGNQAREGGKQATAAFVPAGDGLHLILRFAVRTTGRLGGHPGVHELPPPAPAFGGIPLVLDPAVKLVRRQFGS